MLLTVRAAWFTLRTSLAGDAGPRRGEDIGKITISLRDLSWKGGRRTPPCRTHRTHGLKKAIVEYMDIGLAEYDLVYCFTKCTVRLFRRER